MSGSIIRVKGRYGNRRKKVQVGRPKKKRVRNRRVNIQRLEEKAISHMQAAHLGEPANERREKAVAQATTAFVAKKGKVFKANW